MNRHDIFSHRLMRPPGAMSWTTTIALVAIHGFFNSLLRD